MFIATQMVRQIAVARSMKEFEAYLQTVPEDSLVYHGMKNQFLALANGQGGGEDRQNDQPGKAV